MYFDDVADDNMFVLLPVSMEFTGTVLCDSYTCKMIMVKELCSTNLPDHPNV